MYKHFFKHIIDFTLSLIGFIIISPIFIVVWVWLTVVNKGAGALFFQERPGKNEKIFSIIKFKTMNDKRDAQGKLVYDVENLTYQSLIYF